MSFLRTCFTFLIFNWITVSMNNFIMSKFSALNHYYAQRTAVLQNIMFLRFLLHVMCVLYRCSEHCTGAVYIVQVQCTLYRCSVHCSRYMYTPEDSWTWVIRIVVVCKCVSKGWKFYWKLIFFLSSSLENHFLPRCLGCLNRFIQWIK